MPVARTFRIFVISTFDDFKAERDQLQETVFPRLRELCAARRMRLHAIDLRWGISNEAAVDQQTLPICLNEIARCHAAAPYSIFLVLLGDRYGWRPPPPSIPGDELPHLRARLDDDDRRLLDSWYRRDDNADPPHYQLLPRDGERAAFRDPEAWRTLEARIQALLEGAARSLDLPPHRRLVYEASATEQEIAAGPLQLTRPEDRGFCFLRRLDGAPATGAEAFIETDARSRRRLAALKQALREHFGTQVQSFETHWQDDAPSVDLEPFARRVGDTLEGAIERLLARPADHRSRPSPRDSLDEEIEAHRTVAASHLADFTGRGAELAAIARYLAGPDRRPLCLFGAGGIGKSALLAAAWAQASTGHPSALPVVRLLGTTAESSDARSLLAGLCRQLARHYGADADAVSLAYRDLIPAFGEHLARASAAHPLILFLDALDQLAEPEGTGGLAWLPALLPAHVKVVLTTRHGPALELLRGKKIVLGKLAPLEPADVELLLDRWLRGPPARRLTPRQRRTVLDSFAPSRLPLQLRLAYVQARRWTAEESPAELAPDVAGLLRHHLFPHLERPEGHGEAMVARTLGYLAASRFGLAEEEILDLLSRDPEVYAAFLVDAHHLPADAVRCARDQMAAQGVDGAAEPWLERLRQDAAAVRTFCTAAWRGHNGPRLPPVLWARLAADLEPYLAERPGVTGPLLGFYHQEVAEAAGERYLAGGWDVELHRRLAVYFQSRADPDGDGRWSGDARGVAELPFHLTRARRWREVVDTLTDFRFLESKVAAGAAAGNAAASATGVLAIADDLDRALQELPAAGAATPGGEKARAPIIVTPRRRPWLAELYARLRSALS